MTSRINLSTANPPPEVISLFSKHGGILPHIEGFLAVPSLNPPLRPLSRSAIATDSINPFNVLNGFIGHKNFTRSLRMIDLVTGCSRYCHNCYLDVPLASSMFNGDQFIEWLHDRNSQIMLHPYELRYGNAGDPIDHSDLIRILEHSLRLQNPYIKALSRKPRGILAIG